MVMLTDPDVFSVETPPAIGLVQASEIPQMLMELLVRLPC